MFDNAFFAAAIGIAPIAAISLALLLIKKKKARFAALTALLALCAAYLVFLGVKNPTADKEEAKRADNLLFSYALACEGEPALAAKSLSYSKGDIYTPEHTLAAARFAALRGSASKAEALYGKLGLRPETYEEAGQAAQQYVKNAANGADYKKAASIAAFADETYESFINGGYERGSLTETADCKSALRRLTRIYGETPELLSAAPLRIARMKLQILTEDFKGIADSVDDYADYNELLIVSELYMNGYIKPNQFSQGYRGGSGDEYRAVSEELSRVYDSDYKNKDRDEREEFKAQITALNSFIKNPALYKLKAALGSYAESDFAYDRSKAYMQLSRIGLFMGDQSSFSQNLDKSLNTVGDCDDPAYTSPMFEIIGIIGDKNSPERLKEIARYTDKILTNTMTVKVPDGLRVSAPAAAQAKEGRGQQGGGEAEPESKSESDFASEFKTQLNTYVNQKHMAINIVSIDASDLGAVNVYFNINKGSSRHDAEIASLLRVTDCDIEIPDYTAEKTVFENANILLCADVSGSMDGQKIIDLRNAARMFIESSDKAESIALVTFSNDVNSVYPFGAPNETLISVADSLRAGGGTDMYHAAIESLKLFNARPNEINCVILMSDGGDNYPKSLEEIEANIGAPYRAAGVTLYSLGLGYDAEVSYLSAIAECTGGSYVYAEDSAQMQKFFDGLRSQVLNSYRLTFAAKDDIRANRSLKIAMSGESYVFDERAYYIEGGDPDSESGGAVFLKSKALYGFSEKLVYTGATSRGVTFKGEGFEPADTFAVTLKGGIDYPLAVKYRDNTSLDVTIPYGVACGVYDVAVSVNGKEALLADAVALAVQGSEKETQFGPRIFTSYFKYTEDGVTKLSNYVTEDGKLIYMGDVFIHNEQGGAYE